MSRFDDSSLGENSLFNSLSRSSTIFNGSPEDAPEIRELL